MKTSSLACWRSVRAVAAIFVVPACLAVPVPAAAANHSAMQSRVASSPGVQIGNTAVPDLRIDFVSGSRAFALNSLPASNSSGFASAPSVLLYTIDAGADWHSRLFPAADGTVAGIAFVSTSAGFAVSNPDSPAASGPRLLHTTDAGAQWSNVTLPAGASHAVFTDIRFVDALHGWASGADAEASGNPLVLSTADGGQTWNMQALPASLGAGEVQAVSFDSPAQGWAIGQDAAGAFLLATSDGGVTWTPEILPSGIDQLFAVASAGGDAWADGVAGTQGVVIASGNGGAWQKQTTPAVLGLDSLAFSSISDGWAAGLATSGGPVVLHTLDGGATWSTAAIPPSVNEPAAIATVAGGDTWVIGGGECASNAAIAMTADAGASWNTQLDMAQAEAQFDAIAMRGKYGAALAEGCGSHVLVSDDAARFWVPARRFPAGFTGTSLAFPDRTHIWVAGSKSGTPLIEASGDDGASWAAQSVPAGLTLGSITFGSDHSGWAIANGAPSVSSILGTSTGGDHWNTETIPPALELTALAAASASQVWAVGSSTSGAGAVIASTDGGTTWASQAVPAGIASLNDVTFADSSHGWAVGQDTGGNGAILATTDGGVTWQQQLNAPTTGPITSVSAATDSVVWALAGSRVLGTGDGGATWLMKRASVIIPQPKQLAAINPNAVADIGFKASEVPVIGRSTDSGTSWDPMGVFDPAWVTLSTIAGAPGSTVTMDGHGFQAGEAVDIFWAATSAPHQHVNADSNGSFSVSLTVPSLASAKYALTARGKLSLSAPYHYFAVS